MELVLRATVVYFFLLVLLRATGKRELGHLAPMDLAILLIISEALSKSITNGDESIIGGLILGTTLGFWHIIIAAVTFKSKKMRDLADGVAVTLVTNGEMDDEAMRAERVPEEEVLAEARKVGIESLEQIRKAVLETSGSITIIPKGPPAVLPGQAVEAHPPE